MNRWVFCMALVVGGCAATMPDDPTLTADLACESALALVGGGSRPAPSPPSQKCDNCDGTGKVGDGRVFVKCPVCDGTGKRRVAAETIK